MSKTETKHFTDDTGYDRSIYADIDHDAKTVEFYALTPNYNFMENVVYSYPYYHPDDDTDTDSRLVRKHRNVTHCMGNSQCRKFLSNNHYRVKDHTSCTSSGT